jgi:flavin-dependent dehydrogenase
LASSKKEKFRLIAQTAVPGFILDRHIFVNDIISKYENLGGKLLKCSKAIEVKHSSGCFVVTLRDTFSQNYLFIKTRIIAGADGPLSFTGKLISTGKFVSMDTGISIDTSAALPEDRSAGADSSSDTDVDSDISIGLERYHATHSTISSTNSAFMYAIQQNPAILPDQPHCHKVFFAPYIRCGYGWIFPKTESINLGIGQDSASGLKDTLDVFINHLASCGFLDPDLTDLKLGFADLNPGLADFNSNKKTTTITGIAPVSGIVEKPVSGGLILVGDAAGLCNPVTGAGIFNAIYSASIVLETILKALKHKNLKILEEIKQVYKKEFGSSINRALERKVFMTKNWNDYMSPALPDLIRQSRVAFKDYWK